METEAQESKSLREQNLITSFCEITSSSVEDARFFLESHNWVLDAAVSTFLDDAPAAAVVADSDRDQPMNPPVSRSPSPEYVPSRSRSPDPEPEPEPTRRRPYDLRSRRAADKKPSGSCTRGVRTLADLNRPAEGDSGSDSDEPPQYYTGGEKSGMLVQDPTKGYDVDAFFNQAKKSGDVVENPPQPSSSSRSFSGTGRLLTGDTVAATPQPPNAINHTIVFWRNGFTVNDGPLRLLDDPQNAQFLESIKRSEYPAELAPADRETPVTVSLTKRNEDYIEPVKPRASFQGVGRTLGGGSGGPTASSSASTEQSSATYRAPVPSMGLIVEDSSPSTSLQLRLADGTRMVSRFNFHHTIRDVRSFIDASRPAGPRNYHLQIMGFPPKQLNDLDQTIEQAGIANSVIIQKL